MTINAIKTFKIVYIFGLVVLFLSSFVEWYSFQIYTLDYELIVSWNYNIFKEWSTLLVPSSQLNEALRPENLSLPLSLNIIFMSSLVVSVFVVLFKNLEQASSIANYRPYSYALGITLVLNMFYIIIFPVMYLIPHELYFPFLHILDYDTNFIFLYHLDIGYAFHLIGFTFIFPFTIFYYRTVSKFNNKERTPENLVNILVKKVQEPLDLDKLIAQEELTYQNSNNVSQEDNLRNIVQSFIEGEN